MTDRLAMARAGVAGALFTLGIALLVVADPVGVVPLGSAALCCWLVRAM